MGENKMKKIVKERCDGCGELKKIIYKENTKIGKVYFCKKCYIPKKKVKTK